MWIRIGLCYDFKIYTGNDKINSNDSASESVVKELSQLVLYKGLLIYLYTLYLDNWYFSPKLFITLVNSKINVVEIVVRTERIFC